MSPNERIVQRLKKIAEEIAEMAHEELLGPCACPASLISVAIVVDIPQPLSDLHEQIEVLKAPS